MRLNKPGRSGIMLLKYDYKLAKQCYFWIVALLAKEFINKGIIERILKKKKQFDVK